MPIYTAYAKIIKTGKHTHHVRNTPVFTFHEKPIDWYDLKNTLNDMARKIYNEIEQQTTTMIRIDKHLGGRYIHKMINYRDSHLHYRRQPEFMARLRYNPTRDITKIENPQFITPEFYEFKADYDRDIGKKWKIKPLIKGFEATLLNPDSTSFNLLTVKNSIYDRPTDEPYATRQQQTFSLGSYDKLPLGMYGPSNEFIVERDVAEKERQIRG
jgi:hypothetical protein